VVKRFSYRAVGRDGRPTEGQLRAADLPEAARGLIAQGLTPLLIAPVDATPRDQQGKVGKRPTPRAMQVLLDELSTLLGAGVSLAEALPSLASSYSRHPLGPILARADQRVRAGASLSAALDDPALSWPPYVVALMRASEASGEMAQSLRQGAEQMAHDLEAAHELRSALVYPAILVIAGVVAVLIVFIGVIPRFAGLLKGSRAQIPDFSRSVIEFGVFLQQHILWIAWGAAIMVAVVYWGLSQTGVRKQALKLCARLPVIGDWLRCIDTGRWALVLGTLLESRVPMLDALRLAAEPILLDDMRRGVLNAARTVQEGGALSHQLEAQPWFPDVRVNLIRVGERAGELPKMLKTLGQIETQHARSLQRRLLAIVEPVAILIIGSVIAFLMIAVMTAVTSLNSFAG
jgi:general secretion pathway protein F